jgi:hypothetical protein
MGHVRSRSLLPSARRRWWRHNHNIRIVLLYAHTTIILLLLLYIYIYIYIRVPTYSCTARGRTAGREADKRRSLTFIIAFRRRRRRRRLLLGDPNDKRPDRNVKSI